MRLAVLVVVTYRVAPKGEKLVRNLIAELDARVKALHAAQADGRLGYRVVRARLRYAKHDYDKLCVIARRYGFEV